MSYFIRLFPHDSGVAHRYGPDPPCGLPPALPPRRRPRRRGRLDRDSPDVLLDGPPAGLPPSFAAGRAEPRACTAALAAFFASFSFARLRSSAFRARISAMRSAIGTSNRCFGLLA